MRVCESIASISFQGDIRAFREKDFLIEIESIIKKDPSASRCLMIIAPENHDFKFLDNIICMCQLNLYPKKEFILDSLVCLECDRDEIEIEFYLYDIYECIHNI